jgi:hypothetical protein
MRHTHERRSTYDRVVELLSDGDWHCEPELLRVSAFPAHWVTELAREGHEVKETEDGGRLVRLATAN